ncbi:uncharacterized protein [Neodiprion pinetum]|uniref:uncharacterized protein n=1 Tax=Neodiprion pinetum TaxID=441929 RepID=UPI001EDE689B|nr:uncharacterized protein LOC124218791 [Neodiprion pinetum]
MLVSRSLINTGRNAANSSSANPHAKMYLFLLMLACALLTNNSLGHPMPEEDASASGTVTIDNQSTTQSPSILAITELIASIIDDINPATDIPPVQISFSDVPVHTESKLGSSVLLPCRTVNPVAECQWSWQPLPPRHLPLPDMSEIPTISTITPDDQNSSTASAPLTQSLPIRKFPAFGNNSNDCSVRFSSAKHEQAGYWTCAVRQSNSAELISTEPAKLTIISSDHELPITFIQRPTVVESPVGSSTQITCKTDTSVKECQWSWRQLNQSQPWNLEVKRFPAFGDDSRDCSIKFKNVLPEQEGYWTCGARVNPNSTFAQSSPIRFLISEVEFVQLSRDIQIAAGETVLLRCSINKPVVRCEWSWKPSNSSKNPITVKKFSPSKDSDHDCSVRFKNILYEEEGLWTCGVKLTPDGVLHEAPPAVVTLLPPAKVSFVETPEDTSVPIGTEANLNCITNVRVEKCAWTWKPLTGSDAETVVEEFASKGDLGRDCSLSLPQVYREQQGLWACQVYLPSQNAMQSSPLVKLTVFEVDEVKFSELSQDIQISSGGSVLLRCVTSSGVEQCRWSLTPENSNTTVVVKQFPAAGVESRDCSVRLSHALAEQEGLWTCGARIRGRQNYTDAPPAKLSLLQPEPVMIALWTTPHEKISLACRLRPVPPKAQCHWLHSPNVHLRQTNSSKNSRYAVQMNYTSGLCVLQFKLDDHDLGEWTCRFTGGNAHGNTELGSATVVLLSTSTDARLGWIVGALTSLILFLMIIVVVLVVCRTHIFIKRTPKILETMKADQRNRNNSESAERYTEGPNKINFQFSEQGLQDLESINNKLSSASNEGPKRQNEIYENIAES